MIKYILPFIVLFLFVGCGCEDFASYVSQEKYNQLQNRYNIMLLNQRILIQKNIKIKSKLNNIKKKMIKLERENKSLRDQFRKDKEAFVHMYR